MHRCMVFLIINYNLREYLAQSIQKMSYNILTQGSQIYHPKVAIATFLRKFSSHFPFIATFSKIWSGALF
jgi:hypothetical protein